ncbi:MAG TPA: beta-ketoacyl-ACP synthase [Alphaproteobacteria bacterium]|nr:beta-ketoacyl-ACP synthase [Alphaproteobacteria bacterium]
MAREVWITGYGLLSPQGETPEAWWPKLQDPAQFRQAIDSESFPPFHVFPIRDYDLSRQVPKPGDQRAMGPLMHYGAYAAGVALDAAGVKGNEALLLETHLVVAAGGGERDWTLDHQLIAELDKAPDKAAVLNRRLSDDLRPTLFLAQLPNLFAGNISLVHGVAGSSRTFMGEEPAGIDAVRIAYEKIAAGQGDLFLVGAASNASRPDIIYALHAGGLLMTAPAETNLWDRPEAGVNFGSAGAFLVLEAPEHARARGAKPLARLKAVLNDRSDRRPGAAAAKARRQLDRLLPALKRERLAVLSGACGMRGITREEHGFLGALGEAGIKAAVRGTGAAFGHSFEASFPANLVLAVSCLERRAIFPPLNPGEPLETRIAAGPVDQVVVTSWGTSHGEGMALVEAIDGS